MGQSKGMIPSESLRVSKRCVANRKTYLFRYSKLLFIMVVPRKRKSLFMPWRIGAKD